MSIDSELVGSVLSITLNRPEALNALDIPHLKSLDDCLDQAAADDAVRAVLLRGVGRAFSVGADIKAMDIMSDAEFAQAAELYQTLCRKARALDKPIVAAINGYALGGGLEIALIADLRIADNSARMGLPDAVLGFSPTGGLTYLLNHIVGAGWAMHMAMTAEALDAEKALSIGLVTQIVGSDDLHQTAMSLAAEIATYPPTGMKNIKRSFNAALESSLSSTLALEAEYDAACYRSEETRQALRNFIDSRKK